MKSLHNCQTGEGSAFGYIMLIVIIALANLFIRVLNATKGTMTVQNAHGLRIFTSCVNLRLTHLVVTRYLSWKLTLAPQRIGFGWLVRVFLHVPTLLDSRLVDQDARRSHQPRADLYSVRPVRADPAKLQRSVLIGGSVESATGVRASADVSVFRDRLINSVIIAGASTLLAVVPRHAGGLRLLALSHPRRK